MGFRWHLQGKKHCLLFAVNNRSPAFLLPIIVEQIATGSLIILDQWSSYNGIRNTNQNYNHQTVNHSRHFIDPVTGAHTNAVERIWGVAKSSFRRRNHFKMLGSYLCEFLWRKRLGSTDNPF